MKETGYRLFYRLFYKFGSGIIYVLNIKKNLKKKHRIYINHINLAQDYKIIKEIHNLELLQIAKIL